MIKVTPQIKTIAGRISSIFKPRNSAPPAAKPPPYNDDRHYRLLRLTSVASFTLLILLSIPALVLKAYSYSFIESNAEMGFYLVNGEIPGEPQGQILVTALPDHLFRVPEKLVLVVAMLNLLLSMAQLAFLAWDWKTGRRVSCLCHPKVGSRTDCKADTDTRFPTQCLASTHRQRHSGSGHPDRYVRFP